MLTTLLTILRYSPGLWALGRILNILFKINSFNPWGKRQGIVQKWVCPSPFFFVLKCVLLKLTNLDYDPFCIWLLLWKLFGFYDFFSHSVRHQGTKIQSVILI